MADLFDNPFAEPEPEPDPPLTHFPYARVYKVRNMYFAMDIPVFTAREDQDVKDGYYRLSHIYCCN